ncbi:MAG: DNA polymerase I [Firmicutes bacterium ADurb.Bin080]|jgi:DNA polymerase I|nr:DNA polymerase I [Clostridiales bacterium]OQC12785.1 MAG: DNA polymerase I [Firmicutes bacterium ADurb.Bin080]
MNNIILIDSNSLINRAFYALPPLSNTKGIATNAIFGYLSMLVKLIENEKPTHICAVFDEKGPTFRNEIYSAYKATRKPMPETLATQFPLLKSLLKAMGIKVISYKGYEADDLIGTFSKRFHDQVTIVSGDRDVLQLVDKTTKVLLTKKGVSEILEYTLESLALEGFSPQKVIDYKALAGDHSDNIPGAPGIGEKTALSLLKEFDNVEEVINNTTKIKPRISDIIRNNVEMIILSKELATINVSVPIDLNLSEIVYSPKYSEDFFSILSELEIKALIPRFKKLLNLPEDEEVPVFQRELCEKTDISTEEKHFNDLMRFGLRVEDYLGKRIFEKRVDKSLLVEIKNISELTEILSTNDKKNFSFYMDEFIYFAFDKDTTYVIRCKEDLFEYSFSYDAALFCFSNIFADLKIRKIVFDVKSLKHTLRKRNLLFVKPYEDVLLKEYLLRSHVNVKSISDLLGKDVPVSSYPQYLLFLSEMQDFEIEKLDLNNLYREIELPLVEVLFDMEISGFSVDTEVLNYLSDKYSSEIEKLEEIIYKEAGRRFNINSPKQLSCILFDEMHIKPQGKNKSGGYSVDAEVLESIEHPISDLLLRYRKIKKLLSTYIEGMKPLINKQTGKVHTSFQQCVTTTGRLSSTEPNLQNIPVRNDEGREIRKMLVPSKGNVLITADYSQIELRLLAVFSKDEMLLESYQNNEDIHTSTAAKIYGVSSDQVNQDMRRAAKAINFGIIYGISPFGLSKNIGTSVKIAKDFVDKYFLSHPSVKEYMNENSNFAITNHYIRSMSGRIRFFPEFSQGNNYEKNFAIRAAMNMPLQGSSSDIIKIAMIRVYQELSKKSHRAKLILQVHDELILDVPREESEEIKNILKKCMEEAVKLPIPLIVDLKIGDDWFLAS